MTRKEQIIEILNKTLYIGEEYDTRPLIQYWLLSLLERSADVILALPLDVPSDKELDDEAFSRRYQKNNEFDAMYADAFIYGADWMKNEIIKRNK